MNRKRVFVIFMVMALILGTTAICSGVIPIGEEDVLRISVWDHPELTTTVPVRPGGMISVPFVGEVKASGMSPRELKAQLEKDFSAFIKIPTVSVEVTEVNSFKVFILGAGIMGGDKGDASETHALGGSATHAGEESRMHSGVITLKRDTGLIQLLAQIGFSNNADLSNAYLMRGGKKLDIDFYKLVVAGDVSQDIQLQPNDVIFVPATFNRLIRVVGAVKSPGVLPFTEGMTALDAILSVGGFNEFASQNDVVVIRKEGAVTKNIVVHLKDVLSGYLSKNLTLKPGDIIRVKTGIF